MKKPSLLALSMQQFNTRPHSSAEGDETAGLSFWQKGNILLSLAILAGLAAILWLKLEAGR